MMLPPLRVKRNRWAWLFPSLSQEPKELELAEVWEDSTNDDVTIAMIVPQSSMLYSTSNSDLESLENDDEEEAKDLLVTTEQKQESSRARKEFDVSEYMNARVMNQAQERLNALTILPSVAFCLYFVLAGRWLQPDALEAARTNPMDANDWDQNGCIQSRWFPHLYGIPPIPVMAVAFGICIHAPFSMLYHWRYAHRLPPGSARIEHWSRRLDHAFIHVTSTFLSYATSGSWDYCLANIMFNVDCILRQFRKKVRPRSNKVRIVISVMAYQIPILRRGDITLFLALFTVLAVSFWLFACYPIGGWSHSAFHIVVALVPPLLMSAAMKLPVSQESITRAAQCAILRENLI